MVLIPALLFIWPEASPETMTGISLAIIFANTLSGTIAYARQGRIDYRMGGLFALSTIPGAVFGVWVIRFLHKELFALLFGFLVLSVSIFLQLRPKPSGNRQSALPGSSSRTITDARGETFTYYINRPLGIGMSFAAGFMSGLLGIGGGIIHVPSMIYLLHFPINIATATSLFILVFTSLTASLIHLAVGTYAYNWHLLLWLAVGVISGAQFGAWLSHRVHGVLILRLLALALTILGVRLLFLAF